MGRLKGKKAIVTGAGSGIGRSIAEAFAREGAALLVTDIDAKGLAETVAAAESHGGTVLSTEQDVTDEARWDAVMNEAKVGLGGVSVLVNNAGIAVAGNIVDLSLEDFRRQEAINVDSVFLGTRAAFRSMSEGGSIVNLSSVAGLRGAPGMSAYCASKGAVRLFTKSAALEGAAMDPKIRSNSIHPGIINTPIWNKDIAKLISAAPDNLLAASQPGANEVDPEALGLLASPLARAGTPLEVAGMAVFLASDESQYVTGAEMVVDGGMTAR